MGEVLGTEQNKWDYSTRAFAPVASHKKQEFNSVKQ